MNFDPAVCEELGIDNGLAIAQSNPHYRNTVLGLPKLTGFLDQDGIINAEHRNLWTDLELIAVRLNSHGGRLGADSATTPAIV